MAEYITKEQIIEWFFPYGHTDESIPYYGLVTDIRGMKAADVAPVVHSYWEHKITNDGENINACHNCKYPVSWFWEQANYCPNCGAKMDGCF